MLELAEGATVSKVEAGEMVVSRIVPNPDLAPRWPGILPDWQIEALCQGERPMIEPMVPRKVRDGKPSHGLTSAGYDLRLAPEFLQPYSGVIDPCKPNGGLEWLKHDVDTWELAPNSMILGVTVETVDMPADLFGTVYGKSTNARCGLDLNTTPIEPGWRGRITLEITNVGRNPVRLTAGMGIGQLVLSRMAAAPKEGYGTGIYQDQAGIAAARVA